MSTILPTPPDGRTWLEQARQELKYATTSMTPPNRMDRLGMLSWMGHMENWAKLVQAQLEALVEDGKQAPP